MTMGNQLQFALGFGKGNVERGFAAAHTFKKELQGQGRLARPGTPFVKVHPLGVDTTAEDFIEAGTAGGNPRRLGIVAARQASLVFTHRCPFDSWQSVRPRPAANPQVSSASGMQAPRAP